MHGLLQRAWTRSKGKNLWMRPRRLVSESRLGRISDQFLPACSKKEEHQERHYLQTVIAKQWASLCCVSSAQGGRRYRLQRASFETGCAWRNHQSFPDHKGDRIRNRANNNNWYQEI